MEYSLLNRAIEDEVLPAARALGLGVLPWSPLGRGVLTGKYRTGTPTDSRAATSHFSGFVSTYLGPRSQRIVEAVVQVNDSRKRAMGRKVLAALGDEPATRAAATSRSCSTPSSGPTSRR